MLVYILTTVVPLLRDHPLVPGNCGLTRGVDFHQGDNIMQSYTLAYLEVVLKARWSLIRVVSQEGDYCIWSYKCQFIYSLSDKCLS